MNIQVPITLNASAAYDLNKDGFIDADEQVFADNFDLSLGLRQ